MSNLERWLWACDFVISGIGWFLGGPYAALLCFAVAGLIIFIALTTKEQGESKHRILIDEHTVYVGGVKPWHKWGIGISIICVLGLISYGVVKHAKKPPPVAQSEQPGPDAAKPNTRSSQSAQSESNVASRSEAEPSEKKSEANLQAVTSAARKDRIAQAAPAKTSPREGPGIVPPLVPTPSISPVSSGLETSSSYLSSSLNSRQMPAPSGVDLSGCVSCSVSDSQLGPVNVGVGPVVLDHDVIQGGVICAKRGQMLAEVSEDCRAIALADGRVDNTNAALDNTNGKIGEAYVSGNIVRPPAGGGTAKAIENSHGEIQKLAVTNNDIGAAPTRIDTSAEILEEIRTVLEKDRESEEMGGCPAGTSVELKMVGNDISYYLCKRKCFAAWKKVNPKNLDFDDVRISQPFDDHKLAVVEIPCLHPNTVQGFCLTEEVGTFPSNECVKKKLKTDYYQSFQMTVHTDNVDSVLRLWQKFSAGNK